MTYDYTATFTFETGDPVAASFDDLAVLDEIKRTMDEEFRAVRAILIEVNGQGEAS